MCVPGALIPVGESASAIGPAEALTMWLTGIEIVFFRAQTLCIPSSSTRS